MKFKFLCSAILSIIIIFCNRDYAAVSALTDSKNTQTTDSKPDVNPMKLTLTTPWANTTVKLVVPGTAGPPLKKSTTVEVPAKSATYSSNFGQPRQMSLNILAITDPYTKRICIVAGPGPGFEKTYFYVSSSSGVLAYFVGPWLLIQSTSYVSMAAGGSVDAAIAQFEANFDGQKMKDLMVDAALNKKISLPTGGYFFTQEMPGPPGPGGAGGKIAVEAVDITDDSMFLDLRNMSAKLSATYSIDLKAKKVTRLVEDGQEMDLSAKPLPVPLKKN